MKFWQYILVVTAMLVLAACEGSQSRGASAGKPTPTSKAIDLTILHMNDHHSHLSSDDFDFDVSNLNLDATTETGAISEVAVSYGGFPMMVSLFDALEKQYTNVLKLHAGDAITGTLYYSLFQGTADAAVMNEICFDAFALGNHEFDDGDAGLASFLDGLNSSACQTDVLAANVNPGATSAIAEDYIKPYAIYEFEGEQVGVVGIDIAGKTKNSSNPDEDTTFADETTTAQANIDLLIGMGVNKIILLTHYQYANDLSMAANLNGVDVIVGGDSHTLLGGSTFTDLGFNPGGDYPTVVNDAGGNMVCVVQAWEYAHIMAKLEVSFDADGDVTSCGGQPYLPIADNFVYALNDSEDRVLSSADASKVVQALTAHPEIVLSQADPATSTLLTNFDAQTAALEQTVIGSVAQNLCLERIPGQGRTTICSASDTYVQGSDISNIVAKAFLTVTPTAQIGIQNGGGVRVDVAAGDFTIANAFTLLPFSNTLVTIDMSGQQIIDVLEEALTYTIDPDGSTGAYPYASGLRYAVDMSQDAGSRIASVEVNPRVESRWTPIDLTATYKVVTNNFIAAGRDGYLTFGTLTSVDTFTEYAQGFIDYVETLTEDGGSLMKLPAAEYSTKSYTNANGCLHEAATLCL